MSLLRVVATIAAVLVAPCAMGAAIALWARDTWVQNRLSNRLTGGTK